jgi:signal transduction histidine kinase
MEATVGALPGARIGPWIAPGSTHGLIPRTLVTTYGLRMRGIPAPRGLDSALAAVLAIWWVAEVGTLDELGAVSLALMTIPIAWRRSAPLASVALVAGGFALSAAAADPPEPIAQLVAMLVAPYSVAVHARGARRASAGCAIAVAGALAAGVLVGDDIVFILVLVGIACAAGFAVRRLGDRSTELEAQAIRLDLQARTAAAEERERIARELHDIVSHSVSLMVVQAGAAEQVLRHDPEQAERALGGIQATGRAAVDDLRRMLGLLRGADATGRLAPQPGLAAVDDLAAAAREAGTPIALDRGDLPGLPPGIELAAYRIVQESLTNATKHAPGCATTVRLGRTGGDLTIEVRTATPPRGNGASPNGTGHGVVGMRERAGVYGGELHAGYDEQADWVVLARLPIASP